MRARPFGDGPSVAVLGGGFGQDTSTPTAHVHRVADVLDRPGRVPAAPRTWTALPPHLYGTSLVLP